MKFEQTLEDGEEEQENLMFCSWGLRVQTRCVNQQQQHTEANFAQPPQILIL